MPASFAAITTTAYGLRCLAPLCSEFCDLWISPKLQSKALTLGLQPQIYQASLSSFLQECWGKYEGFVFSLASGAVVRLISPLLTHKDRDPAIVVVDQRGKFAISLCGGHQGGGDRLAQKVSQIIGAQSVLTGSSNALDLPAIDTLGKPFGWVKGEGNWLGVSSAIAHQSSVQVIQEAGMELWQQHLPEGHSFQFGFPEFEDRNAQAEPLARVWISPIKRRFDPNAQMPKVQWHPRVLWIGVGCERDTDRALIEVAIASICEKNHLAEESIAGVATIDLKADEVGLLALTEDNQWPLRCFDAERLKTVSVPSPSDVVAQEVGTPSVCEAAALLAANTDQLRVKKQIVKREGMKGAVTVAIAQSELEATRRMGKLHLVGTGPGSLDQITPAAKAAITDADVVIGYKLYVDLVRSLLRPGQIVEGLPITQERQRAVRAIELANWGLTVAVISSGDCGIYGMAGLVMEQLQATAWDGKTPRVQVFPGVSALQSAASRVGAPLMHDFCAISLSNLLTPWEMIQKRIKSAAEGDFIVALYNPKSKTRTSQIEYARAVFLQHREMDTPVALARSLYRPDERITLTTLEDMVTHDIDMLTTVIIGNRSSRNYKGWFITPRGYLGDLSVGGLIASDSTASDTASDFTVRPVER